MADTEPRRVLLVDDDAAVLKVSQRVLERAGFTVVTADGGEEAMKALTVQQFSAVISDLQMEGMSGLDVLKAVKAHDSDVPVILMTGGPSLSTAIAAMHEGAHRYLMKPVSMKELVETVTRASLLYDLAHLKRQAFALQRRGSGTEVEDERLDAAFTRGLEGLFMVFQPIISWSERTTIGFEALVRSSEPEMKNPALLFETADRFGRSDELSRSIYAAVALRAPEFRDGLLIFVNVHPPDLLDATLHGSGSPLAPFAHKVVLEMTERASLDRMGDIGPVVAGLRRLKYRLAVDDLGTGYAGLSSFTLLSPEFVKLDRSLVMGIEKHPTKQRVVRAMLALCEDLGMKVISEGVETPEERDALVSLGADHLQGYLFGRPATELIEPTLH